MPFVDLSVDPVREYFADGMVEEIITALNRIRWLFVIARSSTATYKGQPLHPKLIGRELGVRYVLEGSIRKDGGRLRIASHLIDALAGAQLWADRLDASIEDVFALPSPEASSRHWWLPRSPARLAARSTMSSSSPICNGRGGLYPQTRCRSVGAPLYFPGLPQLPRTVGLPVSSACGSHPPTLKQEMQCECSGSASFA